MYFEDCLKFRKREEWEFVWKNNKRMLYVIGILKCQDSYAHFQLYKHDNDLLGHNDLFGNFFL